MTPRAVASGTIAFGLVSIPVKLYSAANPSASIPFRLLSREGHKVKQQYVDPLANDAVIERDALVKGYEVSKDRYVIFTEEELRALSERATQTIEIVEFVPENKIPKVYHAKTYYLASERGGDRAYRLLAEALQRSGRVGLAKYAARGKQYLVSVAPEDGGLALHQLHYPDEVLPFSEIPKPEVEVKSAELALAMQLIDQRASDEFHPERYEDEVRQRVEAAIRAKLEGQKLTLAPEAPREGAVVDLLAALEASLGEPQQVGTPQRAPGRVVGQ